MKITLASSDKIFTSNWQKQFDAWPPLRGHLTVGWLHLLADVSVLPASFCGLHPQAGRTAREQKLLEAAHSGQQRQKDTVFSWVLSLTARNTPCSHLAHIAFVSWSKTWLCTHSLTNPCQGDSLRDGNKVLPESHREGQIAEQNSGFLLRKKVWWLMNGD